MIQSLVILSSIIINLSISSRRLLQIGSNPNINPVLPQLPQIPGNIPVVNFPNPGLIPQQISPYIIGFWSQQCLAITPDMTCTTVGQIVSDAGTGTIECSLPSSCCACRTVTCGYEPPPNNQYCDSIKVGAPNALYGVKQVAIKGEVGGSGAVLDCGARGACASTYIMGEWVDTVMCGGPDACRDSTMDLEQSMGISCATRSCIGTTFNLLSNRGGAISCEAPEACMAAIITVVGSIQNIKCGGIRGCKDAKITLTNPMEHFQLSCGGEGSCSGLSVDLIITGLALDTGCPDVLTPPDFIEWKGITCGSLGSCQGLTLNVINNGCRPIRIEDFICIAGQSCTGSNFNFNAGASPYPLQLQNCACGLSCGQATGVDLCFNNIHILECLDINSCSNQQRSLTNIANGFLLLCPNSGSCYNLGLTISIAGGSQNIIQRITAFDCSGYGACSGLTVDIQNMQYFGFGPTPQAIEVVIGAIICSQEFSCKDATFITGPNVKIDNVFCALSNSCENCYIKTDINDPNPRPCGPSPADLQPPIIATTTTTAAPVATSAVNPVPIIITPAPTTPAPVTPAPVVPVMPIPGIPSIPSVPAAACVGAYGQCGGVIIDANAQPIPYTGETCCIDGYVCIEINPQISQCELAASPIFVDPNSIIPPAPITPAPITPAPVTPAPITPSPVTPAPIIPAIPIPDIPSIPSIPSIPDLPIPPQAVPAEAAPIDNPQTGGAPAPPQVDQVPADPITDPIIPVVQTGGTVIETGNSNTNTNGATSNGIVPPSVV